MMCKILLLALALTFATSLEMAVNSLHPRCMVVYTTNEQDHLKIDIKFPKVQYKDANNTYTIELQNTETEEKQKWTIESGTLRKQIKLTQNIVYKLCIQIKLSASGSYEMQQYIDYNTAVRHHGSVFEHQIKVPESLAKVDDFQDSFKNLIVFRDDMEEIRKKHSNNKDFYESMFLAENEKIKKIEFISFIELAAICIMGSFQFFRLKGILESRQG